ncbi:MAG: gamma-glutamyltransferase, partial [Armatimonadetes bacterium]|nr:gamma-glutamyltransferase [Armatimonadota bacterium]
MTSVQCLFAVLAVLFATLGHAQIHPQSSDGGMVVSDSMLASEVGAEILKKGGNAVDAAVATGFALAVVFPSAGNIGGGGFMIVRMADGETVAIDYREMAPGAAHREMYLDENGDVIPGRSTVGRWAAGVPGTVAGFWEAHRKYGKLPWRDVVAPAVRLAREGYIVSASRARSLKARASAFEPFKDSYRIFNRNGDFYQEGELLKQPDLAATFERIRDDGRDGFYKGETARLFVEDARNNGGPFTQKDFDNYVAKVRTPLKGTYKGHEIVTMPPPSSGGAAVIQMLNMLEQYNPAAMEVGSARYVHRLVETMKLAFADRAKHMGDPDYADVPVGAIISKEYAHALNLSIDPVRATPSTEISAGVFPPKEGENTTHFSVVDADGNAVANTYTLNTSYGSLVIAEGTGVLLNNEMDDFTSKPGVPNTFGLIQGEANSIAPGKRPLSSMTPTIVLKDGALLMVTGSPGGPTIINTVLHSILNVIEHGMTVQEAVAYPRFHHQWMPDSVRWEPRGLSRDTRSLLEGMGHTLVSRGRMGSCH